MSHPGLPHDAVFYPSSDGQPMAETALHRRCMVDVADTLELWFRKHGRDDVYVGSNNFLYESTPAALPDRANQRRDQHGAARTPPTRPPIPISPVPRSRFADHTAPSAPSAGISTFKRWYRHSREGGDTVI